MLVPILSSALAFAALRDSEPVATVALNTARHEVTVTAGPFSVRAMPPGMKHEEMGMMEDHNTPLIRFEWPVDGSLRGFGIEIVDSAGRPVDRKMVHHLIAINFDRRQLLYPMYERIFGIGSETADASVPKSIGVPVRRGNKMGMYLAWANETGRDVIGARVILRLTYSPTNLNPRPLAALPIYMDVNLTVGKGNEYDIPSGRSEKSWEFTPTIGGRILGISGHLHDLGVQVRLEDAQTGKVLTTVAAQRGPGGKVTGVERKLFGVSGAGIRLRAGRAYRVVGVYDNPGAPIANGAMAHLVGLFAPDDMSKWPSLDLSDEGLQDDLAYLNEMGMKGGHKHGGN